MTFECYSLRYVTNLSAIDKSADGGALCCLIGGRHRAVLTDGEQSAENRADHPDFTVCNNIIRCVYRTDWYLADSLPFVLGSL